MSNYDHKQNAKRFVTGLGNGVASLDALAACVLHASVEKNASNLIDLTERCVRRNDVEAAQCVAKICNHIFGTSAKISVNLDKGTVTYKRAETKGGGKAPLRFGKAAMAALEEMVASGVTIRDKRRIAAKFAVKRGEVSPDEKLARALRVYFGNGGTLEGARTISVAVMEDMMSKEAA